MKWKSQEQFPAFEYESCLGLVHLEGRTPARVFGETGMEDREVDQSVSGEIEVHLKRRHRVQVSCKKRINNDDELMRPMISTPFPDSRT